MTYFFLWSIKSEQIFNQLFFFLLLRFAFSSQIILWELLLVMEPSSLVTIFFFTKVIAQFSNQNLALTCVPLIHVYYNTIYSCHCQYFTAEALGRCKIITKRGDSHSVLDWHKGWAKLYTLDNKDFTIQCTHQES